MKRLYVIFREGIISSDSVFEDDKLAPPEIIDVVSSMTKADEICDENITEGYYCYWQEAISSED